MTVRIKQLFRVAGAVPPVPPVPVTMRFVQQPTDTEVNEEFDPPVSVQISDGAQDTLIITGESGTCTISFQYAVADSNGLAVFDGLTAGSTPSGLDGCTLRVHNLTRPEVADIISAPFHVLPIPPVWTFIDSAAVGSPDGSSLTIPINISGANLVVVTIVAWNYPVPPVEVVSDSLGNTYTPLTMFSTFAPGRFEGLQSFVLINPSSTGNTEISVVAETEDLTYPSATVFAFRAPNPTILIEGPQYGNTLDSALSIQSQTPATIPNEETLVLTGCYTGIIGPAGYTLEQVDYESAAHLNSASGFRIVQGPAIENPLWQTPDESLLIMNLIVFRGQ